MLANKLILDKINKFAIPLISTDEAEDIIKLSTASTPVLIFWETLDDGRTAREMFWGRYKGGKASQTRQREGMIALVSQDNGGEYRTVIWDTIWKLKYFDENLDRYKTVYVK
jgi:hypothetical protein